MFQFSKMAAVSLIALAIGLSGCGGSETNVASAPPPPITPPPPPPPSPPPVGLASIGAPAAAAAPNASLFPVAISGGPTITAHPSTVFPLLETVMLTNASGAGADTATTNAGASLKSSSGNYQINIDNPALGISNQPLVLDWCGYCAAAGARHVYVDIADSETSALSWTTYGTWGVHADFESPSTTSAAFVTGYKTPAGAVPTTGTASYNGSVVGQVMTPAAGMENGVSVAGLSGRASLGANFSTDVIDGNLLGMVAGSLPWNSVSLTGTISGAQFAGTSAATSAPASPLSLSGSATGTFAGMFFGPNAQELGAVWTLSDGTGAAFGSFGAMADPGCGSGGGADCWAY